MTTAQKTSRFRDEGFMRRKFDENDGGQNAALVNQVTDCGNWPPYRASGRGCDALTVPT